MCVRESACGIKSDDSFQCVIHINFDTQIQMFSCLNCCNDIVGPARPKKMQNSNQFMSFNQIGSSINKHVDRIQSYKSCLRIPTF